MNNYPTIFLASFLIWVMYAGILVLWLADGRIKKEQALHAFIASISSWVVAQMIKGLFPTLRPFKMNGGSPLTLMVPEDGSFPSGHSAAAFGLAVTVWLHSKKLGIIYLLAALGVGLGRIWANVHFPTDIIGGAILGSVVAFFVEKVHLYKRA
jgi:membrane-associated phospholipid phosphatase